MITVNIQIQDIPIETYDTIRRRAEAAGQSAGEYLRDQMVAMASQPIEVADQP